jgi:hypothetical protein
MGRLARIAIALTLAVAVFFAGTGVALAATVMATGVVTVRVAEGGPDGTNLYLPVPAILIDLGFGVAEIAVPRDELERMRDEVAPYAPMLRTVADELERCPDAVLVDVVTNTESVQVTKRGGTFLVEVDAEDAHVRVAFPARTMSRVARFLDA